MEVVTTLVKGLFLDTKFFESNIKNSFRLLPEEYAICALYHSHLCQPVIFVQLLWNGSIHPDSLPCVVCTMTTQFFCFRTFFNQPGLRYYLEEVVRKTAPRATLKE